VEVLLSLGCLLAFPAVILLAVGLPV